MSLLQAIRILGIPTLLRLSRSRKSVWEQLISPHFVTRCLQTLLEIGALDEMREQGGIDVAKFAARHDLDGRLLTALCEALYARRIFSKHGGRFVLDRKGREILDSQLACGWLQLAYGYEPVLFHLEALLRKQTKYGNGLQRDSRAVAIGSGLASIGFYFPLVLDRIRQAGYKRVLDLGCGDGMFLRFLCERMPEVEGVGVDLAPEAVEAGKKEVAARGLEKRIRLHVGDAAEIHALKEHLTGVDAATTFFVLHELCDNNQNLGALRLLEAFREALPGVPFHVIETVRPTPQEMRRRPGPAIEYFLFHDLSSQMPVGRQTWKELFQRSGFKSIDEDYLEFARTSIYTLQ